MAAVLYFSTCVSAGNTAPAGQFAAFFDVPALGAFAPSVSDPYSNNGTRPLGGGARAGILHPRVTPRAGGRIDCSASVLHILQPSWPASFTGGFQA